MTLLSDILNTDDLSAEVAAGYVKVNRHPTLPLSIYTYTRPCQYEGHWTDVTRLCRGLVVDDDGIVVARPLKKFFNLGEYGVRDYAMDPLPLEPFDVYEKVDGSLAIVFCYAGKWMAASKGSFISDQAQWAQTWLDSCDLTGLQPGVTYCAEAIYPSNRIVVDYGDREDLVLLAAFWDNGSELSLDEIRPQWQGIGSVVNDYPFHADTVIEMEDLCADPSVVGTESEGFVIRFKSGLRAKCKYASYVHLHHILTGVSERDIWRAIAFDHLSQWVPSGKLSWDQIAQAIKCSIDEVRQLASSGRPARDAILEGVPDEFDQWARGVISRLWDEYARASDKDLAVWLSVYHLTDRGDFARAVMAATDDRQARSRLFALRDGKMTAPILWKSLYPSAATPFMKDDDG